MSLTLNIDLERELSLSDLLGRLMVSTEVVSLLSKYWVRVGRRRDRTLTLSCSFSESSDKSSSSSNSSSRLEEDGAPSADSCLSRTVRMCF